MAQKVMKWVSNDGRLFDTESEAINHEERGRLSEILADALECSETVALTYVDDILRQGWVVPNLLSSLLRRKGVLPPISQPKPENP